MGYGPWGCKESDTTEQLKQLQGQIATWSQCMRYVIIRDHRVDTCFSFFFKVSFSFGKELALFLVQATSSSRISCACVCVFVQAPPGEAVWSPEGHRTMSPFRGVYQSPVCTVT